MKQGPVGTYDFFIAHAGPDKDIAERLYECLLRVRYKCFLDSKGLRAGTLFPEELQKAQSNSRATIVIVSENTGAAFYQGEEIVEAVRLWKEGPGHDVFPILIVRGEASPKLPYGLQSFHSLRLREDDRESPVEIATQLLGLLPLRGRNREIHAFLLACDISDFSLIEGIDAQVDAYTMLSDSIRVALKDRDLVISDDMQGMVIWSPGGDGGTLTITAGGARQVLELAIQVATEIGRRNRENKTNISLALALHDGSVVVGPDLNGAPNVWGSAINEVNHMLPVCPKGQILASKAFFDSVKSVAEDSYAAIQRFGPERKRALKHGNLVPVRLMSILPSTESFDRLDEGSDPVDILDFEAPRSEMISRYKVLLNEAAAARSGVWTLLLARRLKDLQGIPMAQYITLIRRVSVAGQRDKDSPHHPLFSQFDDVALRTVLDSGSFSHLRAGTKLCSIDDVADSMFVVAQGRIDVVREGEILAKRRPGDLIGEMALIEPITCRLKTEGLRRTADLEAFENSTLFVLPYAAFAEASQKSDEVQGALRRLYQRKQKESFLQRSSFFEKVSISLSRAEISNLVEWSRLVGVGASERFEFEGSEGALVLCGVGQINIESVESAFKVKNVSTGLHAILVEPATYFLEGITPAECLCVWGEHWRWWKDSIESHPGLSNIL